MVLSPLATELACILWLLSRTTRHPYWLNEVVAPTVASESSLVVRCCPSLVPYSVSRGFQPGRRDDY